MKKLMIICLLLLAACTPYNPNQVVDTDSAKACEIVKNAYGDKFVVAAGALGSVKYDAFAYDSRELPEGVEDVVKNKDVFVVNAIILKVERSDSTQIKAQYLVNIATGVSEFYSGEINGEPSSLFQVGLKMY